MKNLTSLLWLLLMTSSVVSYAQKSEYPKGNVFGTVYFDAFSEISQGENQTAMEIRRAYFGYKYHYNENLQAYLKLDIGSPNDLSAFSLIRRYAYFKNAGLKYHKNQLTVNLGITDVLMFTVQEKYWGHRYIEKSFLDRFHFGPKADIGANVIWKFNGKFSMDLGLYNGEGYKNLQNDNTYRGGLGLSILPVKGLMVRIYGDYTQKTVSRYTASFFLGYKLKDKAVFGAEYNYQSNNNFISDKDLFGYSVYGSYDLNAKWEIFGRYDLVHSNIMDNIENPWHIAKDGSAITTGFQYEIHKGVKASLNYQDWVPYASNLMNKHFVFLNFEIKF